MKQPSNKPLDVERYASHSDWLDAFGPLVMKIQSRTVANDLEWLTLFDRDPYGAQVDFGVVPQQMVVSAAQAKVVPDSIRRGAQVLVDKDNLLAKMMPSEDELVPTATNVRTKALTINAPVDKVFPWLLQLGQDKAGLYSYEFIENLLGSDIHNADRIVPEWQNTQAKDANRHSN